jgi:predicted DCC family thiol-disulfide oxidoreductase YuxK
VPPPAEGPILVFDGECVLCSGWVRFVLKRDRAGLLRFTAFQSRTGAELAARCGESFEAPQSLLLVEHGQCFRQSEAIRRVLKQLGVPWRLAALAFRVFPLRLRDAAYRAIGRRRYRWFGRRESCFVPEPGVRERFLP